MQCGITLKCVVLMPALHQFPSSATSFNIIRQVSSYRKLIPPRSQGQVRVGAFNQINEATVRRSANYHPPIWNDDFIQSLRSEFKGKPYTRQLNELKEEVKSLLQKRTRDSLEQLELIDTLQRLGISYHFENEIMRLLEGIYNRIHENDDWKQDNLHATALEFRLLRQQGYAIPQEVFYCFKDEMGNFKTCLCKDINGLLSLYEASYLSINGENILEEARYFSAKHLAECLKWGKDELASIIVSHALELPLHQRMPRLEARWFIDIYEKKEDMNPILLKLAKLDFNIVQSIHQEDLRYVSSWWRSTSIGQKLSFARDRLMENFFCSMGIRFEPQFGYFRRAVTKINCLITLIDDVYDVYGTLDELELFTDVVERWDIDAIDCLPHYMKICFFALFNTINEIAFDVLKKEGVHVVHYLKEVWAELCKCYLVEATWYHNNYKPTLQEYLDNAWISISGRVLIVHGYIIETSVIKKEDLENLKGHDIIRCSSTISRLANDLGTSSDELKRGDILKSIQCYMNDTNVSEDVAHKDIKYLISETWKKMNKIKVENSTCSQLLIEIAMNLARMAQCLYQYGDGHGVEYEDTKDHVISLFIKPMPID